MTDISQNTLASIVIASHRAVPVLEKHHLDFCCKGKRTLADACKEKGLDTSAIVAELQSVNGHEPARHLPFTLMTAEQLVAYIVTNHHYYIVQSMPVIYGHLEKVASKHGDRFPYMKEVFRLFTALQTEMQEHMIKEETIVFPHIV